MNGYICGVAAIFATSLAMAAETPKETKSFPSAGLRTVRVETEIGNISVQGTDKGDVSVEISEAAAGKCRLTTEVRGDILILTALRPDQRSRVNCQAGFRVLAPSRLDFRAISGTGDIEVSSMSGALRTRSGTGDITLRMFSGELTADLGSGTLKGDVVSRKVKAQSGSGAIVLSGLRGSARVQTGSGDMNISWAEVPASADIHLQAGNGNISLAFPVNAKLKTTFQAPPDAVSSEFADEESGAKLFAQVGGGKVSIRKVAR
ncbi:MAG: DUF4097 family beta strand repeat-containing protein [Elusimicrobiota bacterium]|jgi:DUF4097 and DUF4098 domain-containing protein YvlB